MLKAYNCLQSRRGNALVLAVLLLLALTSVGIVSVQNTNTDLLVTANLVRAEQAHSAGDYGTAFGMAQMSTSLNQVIESMQQRNRGVYGNKGTADRRWNMCEFSTAIPDPTGGGMYKHIPIVEPNGAIDESMVRKRMDVAFDVKVVFIGETRGMLGQSVEGAGCFQVFDFNTRGGLPTGTSQTVEDTMEHGDSLVGRNRARAMVGPWLCAYQGL